MVNEDFREEVNEGHKEGEEREVVEGLVADVDGAQAADHRGQQRPDAERPRLQPVHPEITLKHAFLPLFLNEIMQNLLMGLCSSVLMHRAEHC